MHKLVLCAVFAVLVAANSHADEVTTHNTQDHRVVQFRDSDYINLNRQQFAKILQDYEEKLEHFKETYLRSLETINRKNEMVRETIIQMEDRLNPLEVLSELSKHCVSEYRRSVPSVVDTNTAIKRCSTAASSQVTKLLSNCVNTRNNLQSYYIDLYEKHIKDCSKKAKSVEYYTGCIIIATSTASTYTNNNRKRFDNYMDSAKCAAEAYIKRARDCTYNVQTHTISSLAESNLLINKCLDKKDECEPCGEKGHTCPNILQLSDVNLEHQTMNNPFYGLKTYPSCLILRAAKH